jgi:hypothetical protein
MSQNFKDYDESVEQLATSKINLEFDNRGAPHALTVISNLFKTTEKSIIMFSEKLNSEVADKDVFLSHLQNYLKSGKSFKLLLETLPSENERSEALNLVIKKSEEENSNVFIKKLSEEELSEMRSYFTNKDTAYHFIVSDERAFRIETDPVEFKAVCNFNNPEVAKSFTQLFYKFFKEA